MDKPTVRGSLRAVFENRTIRLATFLVAFGVGMALLPTPSKATSDTAYSFISMPDFMNADIGDVTKSPYYQTGQPNSINPSYRQAIASVFTAVEAENIKHVYVAGDLVEGHWGIDDANTCTFGCLNGEASKQNAVTAAGSLYFGQWQQRFTSRGLVTFPAVGDHDIGDNPWKRSSTPIQRFKYDNLSLWRKSFNKELLQKSDGSQRFSDRPASGQARLTAYAVRPSADVQLITVDVFNRTDGNVETKLDKVQLAWVEKVLAKARKDKVKWVIVQGHTPILTPVRAKGSSDLHYKGAHNSALWKLMVKYDVNLYLCGEVHDVTARKRDGVVQISHGGLFAFGGTNYMVGDVSGDTMRLRVMRFNGIADKSSHLWQTRYRNIPIGVSYDTPVYQDGAMTLRSTGEVVSRSGSLAPYNP